MANFKGKRMVDEDLIKKLEDLEPGGGGEYTAGTGIEIDANNEISANIKAGSGIVVDTDMTDDSVVVMIDQADIPYKSDLATVATTGAYSDLSGTPTIPAISANTGATPSTTLTNLDVDGTVYEVPTPTVVSANTGATPSYTLSDIQVGSDVYSIPTGTTVIANSTATPSATLTTLQVGTDTYEVPQGGGSSYTFTNGLTESSGTVSWDLNDNIIRENNGIVLKSGSVNYNITNIGGGNLAFGVTRNSSNSNISTGASNSGLTNYDGGNLAFGFADYQSSSNYGEIISKGQGSLAFGKAGSTSTIKSGIIKVDATNGANGLAFGNTIKGEIKATGNGESIFNIAGGCISGSVYTRITSSGKGSIAYGVTDSTIGDIISSGECSVAIGRGVQATGFDSIALGYKSTCSGAQSEAHGFGTKASGSQQFVIGKNNIEDSAGTYAFIIGNGTADNARSNAMTVSKDGTIVSKNLPAVDTTTDGTYVLKATVSSGVVTYAWVLEV